jgi:hypothetical protein
LGSFLIYDFAVYGQVACTSLRKAVSEPFYSFLLGQVGIAGEATKIVEADPGSSTGSTPPPAAPIAKA